MYVDPGRRLVYLAHPKTASLAVRAVLLELGFVPVVKARASRPYACRAAGSPWRHHGGLREHPGGDWRVFTTVRNPFDAWVSWYAFTRGRPAYAAAAELELGIAFVEHMVETWPAYWPDRRRMWGLHAPVADLVLRYETQAEELGALLSLPGLELPRVNVSRGRPAYREAIGPGLRTYLEARFYVELNELGYAW